MDQPKSCIVLGQQRKMCKHIKSLYSLKQAPKQWHKKIDKVMLFDSFHINIVDKCVYFKKFGDAYAILCLCVDDILIFGSNVQVISAIK